MNVESSLGMSLDDIIASKRKQRPEKGDGPTRAGGGRGRGGGGGVKFGGGRNAAGNVNDRHTGGGPIRRGRRGRSGSTPYSRPDRKEPRGDPDGDWKHDKFDNGAAEKKGSILSRLGGKGANDGCTLYVSNLHYNIINDEVQELFASVGKVKSADVEFDRTGRSTGYATVVFAKKEDAERAFKKFNGRTLDGQPMSLSFDDPKDGAQKTSVTRFGTGLFGGALKDAVDTKPARGGRVSRRGRGPRGRGLHSEDMTDD